MAGEPMDGLDEDTRKRSWISSVVALVPMRAESVRVEGKNVRLLGAIPLYLHILRALAAAKTIDHIVVLTDDEAISPFGLPKGVEHLVLPRDVANASMNDTIAFGMEHVGADLYVQAHATNPFLSSKTVDRAVNAYLDDPSADSAFGVTEIKKRFYSGKGKPINHDPHNLLLTQNLEPVFMDNSCLYVFTAESFKAAENNRIGKNAKMVQVPAAEAMDIDTWEDFHVADVLMGRREE